ANADRRHVDRPANRVLVSRYVAGSDSTTMSTAYGAAAPYAISSALLQNLVASVCVPIGDNSSVAVSSVAIARKTSAAPAPTLGKIKCSVTRMNADVGPTPNACAASSRARGACNKPARILTIASGKNRIVYATSNSGCV